MTDARIRHERRQEVSVDAARRVVNPSLVKQDATEEAVRDSWLGYALIVARKA